MLLIISTVFLFPVSQISTLVSIRHYLFCFFYSRFSVCFSGSFISNLSCYLVNVFRRFNDLWKHFLWICEICTRDALLIIEFQVYCISSLALKYIFRQIQCLYALSCSVMSSSLWPHGLYSTRILCLWDFPGKNTGVGCPFLWDVVKYWVIIRMNYVSKNILAYDDASLKYHLRFCQYSVCAWKLYTHTHTHTHSQTHTPLFLHMHI